MLSRKIINICNDIVRKYGSVTVKHSEVVMKNVFQVYFIKRLHQQCCH